MNLFISTLSQLGFLFGFIAIGYVLMRGKLLPADTSAVLSKLENLLFIPALVMGTFIENFTIERIRSAWQLILVSSIIALLVIPLAILVSRLTSKDPYIQHIFTYGLSFSNFGFMGNAVVSSLFPEIFMEYLLFTLPLWVCIYLWGVPHLLMSDTEHKHTLKDTLKSFVNPMFIGMLIGMMIGLLHIPLPAWLVSIINVSGSCMSPVAMILTGAVVSSISFRETFENAQVYIISAVRLLVFPLLFILIANLFSMSETVFLCALCSLAMPLGLNTIVIPSALGRDTTVAASMAVVSHLLSCTTIPLIFALI